MGGSSQNEHIVTQRYNLTEEPLAVSATDLTPDAGESGAVTKKQNPATWGGVSKSDSMKSAILTENRNKAPVKIRVKGNSLGHPRLVLGERKKWPTLL